MKLSLKSWVKPVAQNGATVDIVIFTYITGVNLDQLWEIFRRFRGYKPSRERKIPLETVIDCFEAILKVLGQTRGTERS